MGEKIKDLVYDFSDIIISLVIITLIFGVVSWKISDSMAYTSFTGQSSKAALSGSSDKGTDNKDNTTVSVGSDNTAGTGTSNQTTTQPVTSTGGKPSASGSTTPTAGSGTATTTTQTTPPATTAPATTAPAAGADFKVEIPSGSSGIAIAKILKEEGIISDTKMFITRVDQLKMGPKLKAGSFTIKSGSTLDDVIYTLAGKKK